jgi:hypothetical protein
MASNISMILKDIGGIDAIEKNHMLAESIKERIDILRRLIILKKNDHNKTQLWIKDIKNLQTRYQEINSAIINVKRIKFSFFHLIAYPCGP